MLAQDNLSSRLTMYDCAFANRARSRSSAPRGSCARLRRTTQVTLYSAAWPHLGQVRVCARCSVVSLKNSRSSIACQLINLPMSRHFHFRSISSILVLAVTKRKPTPFSATKAVKANARERVGQPKPARVLSTEPRTGRATKHKPKLEEIIRRED